MRDALGIIVFLVFIAAVIAAAAGVTWVVVKVSPKPKAKAPPAETT